MTQAMEDVDIEEHSVLLGEERGDESTYTIADVIDRGKIGAFQVHITFFAGFQWISGAMVIFSLGFLGAPVACQWDLDDYQMALFTTMFFLGNMIFGPLYGMISDRYGRKKPSTIALLIIFYFGIMSALSPNYTWLLINRFIVGLAIVAVENVPAYCVEFTPIAFRATSVLLLQLFWGVGASLEALLAYLTINSLGWRYFIAISTLPAGIVFFYSLAMPESPRFLLARGYNERSERVLKQMTKMNCLKQHAGRLVEEEQSSVAVRFRMDEGEREASVGIRKIETKEKSFLSTFRILFSKKYFVVTIIINLIWFISWFVYFGLVLITTEILHQESYCDNNNSTISMGRASRDCQHLSDSDYLGAFITSISEFPGILINILLTECLGRKLTLFIEFLLSSAGFMLLLICKLSRTRVAKIILIFITRAAVSNAIQVSYVSISEIYPTRARATGLSLCATTGSLGALVTPFIAQVLIKSSHEATLMIYGGLTVLAAILSIFLRETRGKILN